MSEEKVYLGSMNDGLFIINTKPSPAPVEAILEGDPDTVIHAKVFDREWAEMAVRACNSHEALVEALEGDWAHRLYMKLLADYGEEDQATGEVVSADIRDLFNDLCSFIAKRLDALQSARKEVEG